MYACASRTLLALFNAVRCQYESDWHGLCCFFSSDIPRIPDTSHPPLESSRYLLWDVGASLYLYVCLYLCLADHTLSIFLGGVAGSIVGMFPLYLCTVCGIFWCIWCIKILYICFSFEKENMSVCHPWSWSWEAICWASQLQTRGNSWPGSVQSSKIPPLTPLKH